MHVPSEEIASMVMEISRLCYNPLKTLAGVPTPSVHSSIDGVPVAGFFWETAPLATISRDMTYCIEDREVIQRDVSVLAWNQSAIR